MLEGMLLGDLFFINYSYIYLTKIYRMLSRDEEIIKDASNSSFFITPKYFQSFFIASKYFQTNGTFFCISCQMPWPMSKTQSSFLIEYGLVDGTCMQRIVLLYFFCIFNE